MRLANSSKGDTKSRHTFPGCVARNNIFSPCTPCILRLSVFALSLYFPQHMDPLPISSAGAFHPHRAVVQTLRVFKTLRVSISRQDLVIHPIDKCTIIGKISADIP